MMGIDDVIGAIAGPLINRLWPDPAQQAQAQLELAKLQQEGAFKQVDADLQKAQIQGDINKQEAASDSIFIAGWRPAIGWVCVSAFAYAGLGRPLIPFVAGLFGHQVPELPPIDDVFTELMLGMLGLGGMRTFEKVKRN